MDRRSCPLLHVFVLSSHQPTNQPTKNRPPHETKQLRRAELRERMLERVEDELKELRAELEEAGACCVRDSWLKAWAYDPA